MRKHLVILLALVLLPSLAREGQRAATPPGPYVVTDLGTFGTVQSAQAHAINDAGQVVGYAAGHPFLWQNGVMTDLTTSAGNRGQALAINNAGQIAGSSTITPTSQAHPVLWENGMMTDLTFRDRDVRRRPDDENDLRAGERRPRRRAE